MVILSLSYGKVNWIRLAHIERLSIHHVENHILFISSANTKENDFDYALFVRSSPMIYSIMFTSEKNERLDLLLLPPGTRIARCEGKEASLARSNSSICRDEGAAVTIYHPKTLLPVGISHEMQIERDKLLSIELVHQGQALLRVWLGNVFSVNSLG